MKIFIVFFECIFLIRVFWTIFVKIVTISLSFFGHSILMLITISRGRLRADFSIMLKSTYNRPLLIVISLKNASLKNNDETIMILTKKFNSFYPYSQHSELRLSRCKIRLPDESLPFFPQNRQKKREYRFRKHFLPQRNYNFFF